MCPIEFFSFKVFQLKRFPCNFIHKTCHQAIDNLEISVKLLL